MSVKIYNRETGKIEIIKSKLLHIGPVKKYDNCNEKLTNDDKIRISEFVNKVKYLGEEFGARVILSTSKYDIFKIHNDFIRDKVNNIKSDIKIKKEKNNDDIDIIKKQLGL